MDIYDSLMFNSCKNEKCFWKKNCRENQNAHFMFNNFFFENRDVYNKI